MGDDWYVKNLPRRDVWRAWNLAWCKTYEIEGKEVPTWVVENNPKRSKKTFGSRVHPWSALLGLGI